MLTGGSRLLTGGGGGVAVNKELRPAQKGASAHRALPGMPDGQSSPASMVGYLKCMYTVRWLMVLV